MVISLLFTLVGISGLKIDTENLQPGNFKISIPHADHPHTLLLSFEAPTVHGSIDLHLENNGYAIEKTIGMRVHGLKLDILIDVLVEKKVKFPGNYFIRRSVFLSVTLRNGSKD